MRSTGGGGFIVGESDASRGKGSCRKVWVSVRKAGEVGEGQQKSGGEGGDKGRIISEGQRGKQKSREGEERKGGE